jgi:hypothetical protein
MTSPIRELGNGTWWTTVSRSLHGPSFSNEGAFVQAVETGVPETGELGPRARRNVGRDCADSGAVR